MKKYVNFQQRKKMRDFLEYAGYFRASRYGKYLLTQVNAFGSKADAKVFFELYDFDMQLRLLLFKYCKKAEVYFKSAIANAISLKTGDAGFYLDKQYYTPTKSEKDKKYEEDLKILLILYFLVLNLVKKFYDKKVMKN